MDMNITNITFSKQQRITNSLFLNANFIENIGLMHGKMGIAIYFFRLAKETDNSVYEEFAGELIDEIYDEIYIKTPCDFENGLAGIGWAIEYLVRNKFIDADTNEVLEEFDNRINHEITLNSPTEIGIHKGICGYIIYLLSRLNSNETGTASFENIRKNLMVLIDQLKQQVENQFIDMNGEVFWNEPVQFDLTWDYTCLIWVLLDLVKIDVCAQEAMILINKLVNPVLNEGKLPKQQSHQLLLALTLQKLKLSSTETFLGFDVETFLTGIRRDIITNELADNSAYLQDGTSGIVFIYKQLFELTKNPFFKQESEYWMALGSEFPLAKKAKSDFKINKGNSENAYGILNGIAGINLY